MIFTNNAPKGMDHFSNGLYLTQYPLLTWYTKMSDARNQLQILVRIDRLRIIILLHAAFPFAALGQQTQNQPQTALCSTLNSALRAANPNTDCREVKAGAVIAPSTDVGRYITALNEAAERYARHFGAPKRPIMLAVGTELLPDQIASLRARNIPLLNWPRTVLDPKVIEAAIRKQIDTQFPAATAEAKADILQKLLAKLSATPGNAGGSVEMGIIQHEFGHLWFMLDFDGLAPRASKSGYGSTAPDWLDEMAAVLVENDAITTKRRSDLKMALRRPGGSRLETQSRLLQRDHPMPRIANGKVGSVAVTIRADATNDAAAALERETVSDFYIQARGFADFVIASTHDDMVFGKISVALSRGQSFERWLSENGAQIGLSDSLPGLEIQWRAWLVEQSAEAVAKA
ncbi:hypothetical protein [Sphingomonas sp. 28-62-20]|uniref:hypothetical protein n=1 Tax=Sphingomonas sp. 28-62-20 TaxID=1970433 RepID=UPI0035A8702C